MNYSLAQIILAARNVDVEGWMEILVLVIVAVIYGLGSIIKAKGRKLEGQADEQLPRKPARRLPARSRGVQEQMQKRTARPVRPVQRQVHRPGAQQARTKFGDLRSAFRKFAAEAEQAFRFETVEPMPEQALPKPQIQPDIQKLPEYTSKAVEVLEGKRVPIPPTMSQSEYLSELLLDYADPEELRRAILHYEILGKPLSLRDTY